MDKNKIDVPLEKLIKVTVFPTPEDHHESEEKDCCGSCQGNGVCLKVDLFASNIIKDIEKH